MSVALQHGYDEQQRQAMAEYAQHSPEFAVAYAAQAAQAYAEQQAAAYAAAQVPPPSTPQAKRVAVV